MAEQKISHVEKIPPLTALYSLLKGYFFAIFGAAIVALFLRVYVIEAFRIPIDFMAPALAPGDHIFVNKLAYGTLGAAGPTRGDVTVFTFPNDPTKDYIKRVVAVGGDTIEIKAGVVNINGKPIGRQMEADLYEEELDGHKYYARWAGASTESRSLIAIKVPEGQVFVLGDNRAKGQDSRTWGFVPVAQLKGRASYIWFSRGVEQGAGFLGVRWSRLMSRVN